MKSKQELAERQREYRKKNPQAHKTAQKRYRDKNRGTAQRKLRQVRGCAKFRGLKWTLPDEVALRLFNSPCEYCGVVNWNHLNGIDRIDSNGHYTEDNVTSCCEHCNWAKRARTVDEFLSHCRDIVTYNNKFI